jgi:hypothetical protein
MATATDVVRAVVASNTLLRDNISTDNGATLQSIGGSILAYTPYMNAFINTLVNRILFQEVHASVYENPLRLFKGAAVPYGTDVQDSIANPAIATPYDATAMSDILTPQNPDVKTVYYRRNRQDKYPVTIYDEQLKGAFVESDPFNRFVQMILNTLSSGDNIDEYELMRSLLTDALNDGNINKTIIATNNDLKAYAEDIVINARSKFLQFQFPSTEYNCYLKMAKKQGVQNPTALKTWTTPDRIAVIMRADIAALTDVDVLAKAFNMSKAEFLGRQVIVDNFGEGNIASKTLAVVCDETAIRTHDNMFKMANTEYNAATLSRKYYLHHWETMAFSPLANAHAFVEA